MFPLAAFVPDPPMEPWHTRSWVASISEPVDWYQDRQGCTVGFPTGSGEAVRRCPSIRGGEHRTFNVAEWRPPDREERGLVALGRWREATVEELVPFPSVAPYYQGARVTVHVALREQPAIVSYEAGSCRKGECGPPYGWWIDWRPPADLDGTSVVRGHGAGDLRYEAAYAAWSSAVLARVRDVEAGEPRASAPTPVAEGLPATRLAAVLPFTMSADVGAPGWLHWYHEVPLDQIHDGYLTRRDFPARGIAIEAAVHATYVGITPVDLEVRCPPVDPYARTRPWWKPKPPPCNTGSTSSDLRLPLWETGGRAALRSVSTELRYAYGAPALWMTRGLRRVPLNVWGAGPTPAVLAYAGRDPVLVSAWSPRTAAPTTERERAALFGLRLPTRALLDAATGQVTLGERAWDVWISGTATGGEALEIAVVGGTSPPRSDAVADAVLVRGLDPGGAEVGPWALPADLTRAPRWLVLRWTRGDTVLATETVALEPAPTRGSRRSPCATVVSDGALVAVDRGICPPMAAMERPRR